MKMFSSRHTHEISATFGSEAVEHNPGGIPSAHDDSLIIFLHIVKTGGTTLRWALENQFTPSTVYRCYESKGGTLAQVAAMSKQRKDRIRFFVTHYGYGVHEFLSKPFTYLTMVRDPVSRTISQYYDFFYKDGKGDCCTLSEYIHRMPFDKQDNIQTRFIAGAINADNVTPQDLDRAKRNLENHFSVIGVLERFEESLALLCRIFDWPSITFVRRNKTKSRPDVIPLSERERKLLKNHNAYDEDLYKFCLDHFESQLANHQITPAYAQTVIRKSSTAKAQLYLSRLHRKVGRAILRIP
jgi:hypothetical protein